MSQQLSHSSVALLIIDDGWTSITTDDDLKSGMFHLIFGETALSFLKFDAGIEWN